MRDRCVTDRLRRLQLWKADYRVRRIPEMRSESISALPAEWPFVVLTRLIKILFVMDCCGAIPINGKRRERTSREVSPAREAHKGEDSETAFHTAATIARL